MRQVKDDKRAYAESFRIQYRNTDPFRGKTAGGSLTERGVMWSRIRRQSLLSQQEMDDVYASALYADLASYL